MKLHYITIEDEKEIHLCQTEGELPIVGQYVYIHNSLNGYSKTRYEVYRVDHSISLHSKPMCDIDPIVRKALTADNTEEVNKLIGGHVYCLNFIDKVIEFSKTHAEVHLKKV
jgi:hypothetical protein